MQDTKLHPGRPLEASEAAEELLQHWPIPDVTASAESLQGRSTAFGTPLEQLYHAGEQGGTEDEEVHTAQEPELPKLTMEELEQIRQDAYEEGLQQGHEQGYIDGFDKGVSEGKEAGFKEGQQQGMEQGVADAKPLLDEQITQLKSLLAALDEPAKRLDQEVEQELLFLATELAKAVILSEIRTNPDIILAALKAATEALPSNDAQCQIYLHPDDLAQVQSHFDEQQLSNRHWQLLSEPTMERGGCHIKQQRSSIDMSLSQRLQQVIGGFLQDAGVPVKG
ncbi:flagellar assembly protein FliH [Pseudoalteromonas sp. BDTF-M6]|uniref:flagellar assembly protein FliH n=1 Tax=Pseudoalteromonas sp. BDTF-M6 TaxID=2796132 RepID=UPI001BAF19EC|nr:flagellar assembly protein FliH [Pseudoalteromonas sp. BDTF-M6]MBS3798810.1 flagellar assembly protein FliH [Pseudoalteromonas sp. BDTF-M6]